LKSLGIAKMALDVASKTRFGGLLALTRLHQLAGVGETKALKSLGGESKGRHYRR